MCLPSLLPSPPSSPSRRGASVTSSNRSPGTERVGATRERGEGVVWQRGGGRRALEGEKKGLEEGLPAIAV